MNSPTERIVDYEEALKADIKFEYVRSGFKDDSLKVSEIVVLCDDYHIYYEIDENLDIYTTGIEYQSVKAPTKSFEEIESMIDIIAAKVLDEYIDDFDGIVF